MGDGGGDTADSADQQSGGAVEALDQFEFVIEGVLSGAGCGYPNGDDRQHEVVLPAFADDEEAIVAMHRPSGHDHQSHKGERSQRSEQAQSQQEPGTNFGRGSKQSVELSRPHPHRIEPTGGAWDPAASEELSVTVSREGQADSDPDD